MTVSTEIKAIARELGVFQGLLARKAHMSHASLSLKLNGRRDMTLPEVERLAAALGTTPQDLIARAERTDALALGVEAHHIKLVASDGDAINETGLVAFGEIAQLGMNVICKTYSKKRTGCSLRRPALFSCTHPVPARSANRR